jgi:hypothetical protein
MAGEVLGDGAAVDVVVDEVVCDAVWVVVPSGCATTTDTAATVVVVVVLDRMSKMESTAL